MKVLFDTNVWLAAFLTHGSCHELLEHCLENHQLLISEFILGEIRRNLRKKLKFSESKIKDILTFIRSNAEMVQESPLPKSICRDPDDDQVLAAAAGGMADCLVSGDKDLLVLKNYQEIPILNPKQFWQWEKTRVP